MGVLDLEDQLMFYGTYHMHPKNIAIHLIFIPQLMFGLFCLSSALSFGESPIPYVPFNLSTIGSIVYAAFYILMEPVAGLIIMPYVMVQSFIGSYLMEHYPSTVWWVAASQVVGWGAQFIGHGVYEKKAPALLDSFVQSFMLAPFFVWMEVLFAVGYRPELHERVQEKIVLNRKRLDALKEANGNGVKKEL
ncbi:DUF962 domain protein [Geopyxis carbonaria]|nr:DUF962 domain protein [Geopyxis carbonaria]